MKAHALMIVVAGLLIAADAKDDAKKELAKLQGVWQVTSMEVDGQKAGEDEVKQVTVVIKDDQYSLKQQDNAVNQGTLILDTSKKPMAVDIKPKEGDNSGEVMKGIIEVKGDTQKVCWARPDKMRPTKFESEDGVTLVVLKKQAKTKEKK